jgi:hypothetical protein
LGFIMYFLCQLFINIFLRKLKWNVTNGYECLHMNCSRQMVIYECLHMNYSRQMVIYECLHMNCSRQMVIYDNHLSWAIHV